MRTFVAIELSEECRENLASAVGRMRNSAQSVRWVDPRGAHLTLKFIGELEEQRVPEAVRALRKAAGEVASFSMSVTGLGSFPPRGKPRVIWAGVEETGGRLHKLADGVEEELHRALGVDREKREFIPHVTLGRVRRGGRCPPVGDLAKDIEKMDFGRVDVDSVVLMKSDLTPEGAVYSGLERVGLDGQ